MKCLRNVRSTARLLVLAGLGMPFAGVTAFADSVPESIRIQQQAEKAYERSPVVPIDRGNAHHRDQKDDEQGSGDVPPPSVPQKTDKHSDK